MLSKFLGRLVSGISIALSALQMNAMADGWKHLSLQSSQANKIQIDYKTEKESFNGCYKCTHYTHALPIWINVSGPSVIPGSEVRAVVVSKQFYPYSSHFELKTYELDLVDAGEGRFTAELDTARFDGGASPVGLRTEGDGYGGTVRFVNEIAIVINGVWQVDPLNKSSNFVMDLK
jgi:hypothetical protein